MSVKWTGDEQLKRNMKEYGRLVNKAVEDLALVYAEAIQTEARNNAPWTDQTSNARQTLRAYINKKAPAGYPNPHQMARDTVVLYLSHGMDYGKWLEIANGGKYSIIMPTLERYYPQVMASVKRIFKDR